MRQGIAASRHTCYSAHACIKCGTVVAGYLIIYIFLASVYLDLRFHNLLIILLLYITWLPLLVACCFAEGTGVLSAGLYEQHDMSRPYHVLLTWEM